MLCEDQAKTSGRDDGRSAKDREDHRAVLVAGINQPRDFLTGIYKHHVCI